VFPHAHAVASLVQAFAHGNLDKAFTLYQELQRDSDEASAVTLSNRFMWQSLIESACRNRCLPLALQVPPPPLLLPSSFQISVTSRER
jgi:hypothetical protein